jgi:hypothetical protein
MKKEYRKIKKVLYIIYMYIFETDNVLRYGLKPKRTPYTPVSKYAEILNKPYKQEKGFKYTGEAGFIGFVLVMFYILINVIR